MTLVREPVGGGVNRAAADPVLGGQSETGRRNPVGDRG